MSANKLLAQVERLLTTCDHLTKQADRAEKVGEAVYHMRVEANAKRADAAQLAAIAQAEALVRIAECMETLVDVLAKREAEANEVWAVVDGLNQRIS